MCVYSCRICLDEYKRDEELSLLPCIHSFHKYCIAEWIKQKAICPLCKSNIIRTGREQYLAMGMIPPHSVSEDEDEDGEDEDEFDEWNDEYDEYGEDDEDDEDDEDEEDEEDNSDLTEVIREENEVLTEILQRGRTRAIFRRVPASSELVGMEVQRPSYLIQPEQGEEQKEVRETQISPSPLIPNITPNSRVSLPSRKSYIYIYIYVYIYIIGLNPNAAPFYPRKVTQTSIFSGINSQKYSNNSASEVPSFTMGKSSKQLNEEKRDIFIVNQINRMKKST